MPTKLNPYLSFRDNARQAMEFYHTVFGGTLHMQTFKEAHASRDPGDDDKLMHAELVADNGITIMASDTPNGMEYQQGASISLSLTGDDEAEIRGYFEKLSTGGAVTMPLDRAPWGDIFGMCADQFGIHWLMNVANSAAVASQASSASSGNTTASE